MKFYPSCYQSTDVCRQPKAGYQWNYLTVIRSFVGDKSNNTYEIETFFVPSVVEIYSHGEKGPIIWRGEGPPN